MMRTNFKFLIIIWSLIISLIGCQKEEINKDIELPVTTEEQGNATETDGSNGLDLTLIVDLDKEILEDLSLRASGPPTYVNNIIFSPLPTTVLPASGMNINVTATGSFTYSLQLKVYEIPPTGVDLATTTITGNGISGNGILQIPAHSGSGQRILLVEAYDPFTQEWRLQDIFYQAASNILFSSNMPDVIPYLGDTYTIFKEGTYPETTGQYVFFRVINDANTPIVDGIVLTSPTQLSLNFTIPINNTGSPRNLRLQYSLDYSTWVTFDQGVQLAENGGGGQINITYAYYTPNGAYPEGSDIQVVLAGTFTEVKVRARAFPDEIESVVKRGVIYPDILYHGHQHDGGGIISIPDVGLNGWHKDHMRDLTAFVGSSGRNWDIEYYDGQNWIPILLRNEDRSVVSQPTYYFRLMNMNSSTYKAERANGYWPIKLEGTWRANEVQIEIRDAYNNLASRLLSLPDPATYNGKGKEIDFVIPLYNNTTGKERTLYLWYRINNIPNPVWRRWDQWQIPCTGWVGAATLIQK